MSTYLTIVSHPLTWTFIGLTLVFFALQSLTAKRSDAPQKPLNQLDGITNPWLRWLAGFAMILVPIWAALLVVVIWSLFRVLLQPEVWFDFTDTNLRWNLALLLALFTALGGLVSAPLALIRVFTTERQTTATEEGLITDRINKAVEGLGAEKTVKKQRTDSDGNLTDRKKEDGKPDYSQPVMIEETKPNMEVRIGAIYALERVARDSLEDHIQIMEILCAYVRQNAPAKDTTPTTNLKEQPKPREDINIAIRVLGRRSEAGKTLEREQRFRLDLRNCDLSGADFATRDYSGAMLHNCRLEACNFRGSDLSGAELFGATLNFSTFYFSNLRGARFDFAKITHPKPVPSGMIESINMADDLTGVCFRGADISALDYIGEPESMNATFGTRDTVLSEELEFQRERSNFKELQWEVRQSNRRGHDIEASQHLEALRKTGFEHWSPFDSNDGATSHYLDRLYHKLDLTEFPFHGTPTSTKQ